MAEILNFCTAFAVQPKTLERGDDKKIKDGYEFDFPEEAMEKCSCNSKPKNKKED